METTAATVAKTLKQLGVTYIFGVPSGNWADYMAAIEAEDGLEFVLVGNEASGGFMADVCWRLTGKIAACFGTFGPGACNLSTGVCCGFLDRSPMIAFTDEMNQNMRHRVTQMNIDHQTLFKPLTKWTTRLERGKVKQTLYKAFDIAMSDMPGPVHIGLPAGMGGQEEPDSPDQESHNIEKPAKAAHAQLQRMETAFKKSRKPLVALGLRAIIAGVGERVLQLLEKYQMPVVLTPMAKGVIPEDHPSYAGVLAHALGNLVGRIHQQADLILGVGYDPVEINYEDWMPEVPLIHIDTQPADLDRNRFTLGADVTGEIAASLDHLLHLHSKQKDWDLAQIEQDKQEMFSAFVLDDESFGPRAVLSELRKKLPADGIMTCDVGAHLHLIGQQWKTPSPECQLMTNGCSSMGFGIPAAIAAKLSLPHREVCCVTGDGGLYMMAGELATAVRIGKRIVFIVISDASLSLIRIKQEAKGHSEYGTKLYGTHAGCGLGERLFGAPVLKATTGSEFSKALDTAFLHNGPVVIEALVDTREYDRFVLKGNK
jgi:acetolactate synthase-1/2/3 large subunit